MFRPLMDLTPLHQRGAPECLGHGRVEGLRAIDDHQQGSGRCAPPAPAWVVRCTRRGRALDPARRRRLKQAAVEQQLRPILAEAERPEPSLRRVPRSGRR